MIPFVDLQIQHASIQNELSNAINDVISNANFIGGNHIQLFEKNFANFIGTEFCIGCANGTDSIEILLKALKIEQGDEVIVPAISWIATSEAVTSVGATPVFVDVDPIYYTIDPNKIEQVITSRTKAIIPVHLYGQPADMDAILHIARKYSLFCIEDCAQAHGAEYKGKKIGTFGDCASFSFFPGKNLGAFGDAGCMVTNNSKIAETARMIANHGQKGKHNHLIEGRNSRMDSIHAAVLNVKLAKLNEWNNLRIQAASLYSEKLETIPLAKPQVRQKAKHVFHLYVIQIENRNGVQKALLEKGIHTAIHYPQALPFLPCYAFKKHDKEDFPIAYSMQNSILSLPLFPFITESQITEVCEQLKLV